MTKSDQSMIERYAGFPRGAQELSAARLAQSVVASLHRAISASGKTAREVAGLLGVTEGAVSQVMSGDGNIRVSTIGRYLRAMGYEARIEIVPVEESAPPITPARRRSPKRQGDETQVAPREERATVSVSHLNVSDGDVVAQAILLVLPHEFPSGAHGRVEAVHDPEKSWHILGAMTTGKSRSRWRTSSVSTVGRDTEGTRFVPKDSGAI
ncbi:helix-turn-helix domain-containing protein [Streptomyces sp. NPDC020917]|uniref:helix-turn-helix domain-containing protein n=1 Tax=Streptomyces sp. NPDC020917 TaxID=3365102 RepID=UPI003788AC38